MKIFTLLTFAIFTGFLFSCKPMQKLPDYIQDGTDTSGKDAIIIPQLRIQKNDLLSIQVYSASTKPELSDAMYNLPAPSGASGAQNAGTSGGFLVDAFGNIEYPRIGLLHVEGMTKQELAEVIKQRINAKDSVLKDPSVIIRFQNFKVTVLGEVNSQGLLTIPGERVTVMQAIGLAGGITDFGLKDKVKIIREIDGKTEIGLIDLSSKKAFTSPYYNLLQNDIVLVEPTKNKARKADQDLAIQRASFGLSVITVLAVLYNIFR